MKSWENFPNVVGDIPKCPEISQAKKYKKNLPRILGRAF